MEKLFLKVLSLFIIIFTVKNLNTDGITLDENTTIKPIVENSHLDKKYQYIRTLKLTYKDLNYCSDSTRVCFINKDSICIYSNKRMSCEIVAFINLNKSNVNWLINNNVNYISIYNRVTDNYYVFSNPDSTYLKNLLSLYNKNISYDY